MTLKRSESTPTGPRIITQYWRNRVRVCEIESSGARLDLHVSQPPGGVEWRVEAHSDHTEGAVVITGVGSTRSAALSNVANAWSDQAPALGLRAFDWKAVTDILRLVQFVD